MSLAKRIALALVLGSAILAAVALVEGGTAEADHVFQDPQAHCVRNGTGAPYAYMYAPAGVPFLRTGFNATQTLWYRPTLYRNTLFGREMVFQPSWWLYNFLNPGRVTTSFWYLYNPGQADHLQVNQWFISQWIGGAQFGAQYYYEYELYWYQNGREIHRTFIRPGHVYDDRVGLRNDSCQWNDQVQPQPALPGSIGSLGPWLDSLGTTGF